MPFLMFAEGRNLAKIIIKMFAHKFQRNFYVFFSRKFHNHLRDKNFVQISKVIF
jgi:hypothetical protein